MKQTDLKTYMEVKKMLERVSRRIFQYVWNKYWDKNPTIVYEGYELTGKHLNIYYTKDSSQIKFVIHAFLADDILDESKDVWFIDGIEADAQNKEAIKSINKEEEPDREKIIRAVRNIAHQSPMSVTDMGYERVFDDEGRPVTFDPNVMSTTVKYNGKTYQYKSGHLWESIMVEDENGKWQDFYYHRDEEPEYVRKYWEKQKNKNKDIKQQIITAETEKSANTIEICLGSNVLLKEPSAAISIDIDKLKTH